MHISLPSIADPQNPGGTITGAIASINRVWLNLGLETYTLEVWIHRSLAAYNANSDPVQRISISAGQVLVPASGSTPAATMPDYAGFDTAAAAAQKTTPTLTPLQAQAVALYTSILSHPTLTGGSIVTP